MKYSKHIVRNKAIEARCESIKKIVQRLSGFEDISFRTRKRPIPELRFIYYYLCRMFVPEASLSLIGFVLGSFDHATVLHGIKTVKNLIDSNSLDRSDVLYESIKVIELEAAKYSEIPEDELEPTIQQLQSKYRIALMQIIDKRQIVMNKLMVKINDLERTNSDLRKAFRMKNNLPVQK